jgi:ankyrin repeat protein
VKYFVEKGANKFARDEALIEAAANGHDDIVEYLVESGANISENGDEALIGAAANGHLAVVKYFVEKGANKFARDEALIEAAANGHDDIVEYLVESGADPSVLEY